MFGKACDERQERLTAALARVGDQLLTTFTTHAEVAVLASEQLRMVAPDAQQVRGQVHLGLWVLGRQPTSEDLGVGVLNKGLERVNQPSPRLVIDRAAVVGIDQ